MKRIILACSLLSMLSIFGQIKTLDTLPVPFATKSKANFSNVIGWEDGRTPIAPQGFKVTKFADGFDNPRWLYITPNGDILVAESNSNYGLFKQIGATLIGAGGSKNLEHSADRITLLRDTDKDGAPDLKDIFLNHDLNQPFGMLVLDDWFYVANTDALLRFPYISGQTRILGAAEKIAGLPAGKNNQHWTRNIITDPYKSKIYIAVGSGTNIAEKGMEGERMKASILEIDPNNGELKVFASGLRNPVGMDWNPNDLTLWATVNERDGLGDNLVPDYFTRIYKNGFYGWPYTYFGLNKDPRVDSPKPEKEEQTIVPDVNLGSHTASLGLVFYRGKSFPKKYHNGAFIAQHGSWNRKDLAGYKVVFIPFENGRPTGPPQDFLSGFIIDPEKDEVYGRPTGVIEMPDGSLLVTDDTSNTIWRIHYRQESSE